MTMIVTAAISAGWTAPGSPVFFVLATLALVLVLVWQILRLRERTRTLRDRQDRVQGLEDILNISARMHAFHDVDHLLNEVADAVRRSLGFRMVLLRIYRTEDKIFEARAFAGVDEEGREYLRSMPLSLAEFRKMTLPQFQVSNSFFIPFDAKGSPVASLGGYVADLGERMAGEWDERDMLIVPLTSPEGEINGYLSIDDPIDRLRPTEKTIERLELFARQAATAISSAELYSRLNLQNQELLDATDRLRYHHDLKNNFVANVSHELRTPLTSIKAYCEALLHGEQKMDSLGRSEFLRVIDQEAEKLTGIVNNLLDLERMEGTQVRFNRHQTDLVALVRGVEGSVRNQAVAKNITLSIHFAQENISLWVDGDQIRQLVRHLIDNAIKFTPSGGTVHLSVLDGVSSVRFVVEDNGIGIPDNKMSYIFDRFYQVDGSSTREYGGQGIGLAICRDIVTRHGGRLWGERVQPRGVRFNALLPKRKDIIQRASTRRKGAFSDQSGFAEKLIQWTGELMRVKIVSLMTPDSNGDHLVIEAAMGLEDHIVQNTRLARGEGIAGRVWQTRETIFIEDVTTLGRAFNSIASGRYSTGSLLSAPVMDGDEVVAVVNVNNRIDGRPFSERDQLLLNGLVTRMGRILGRARDHERSTREFENMLKALRKGVAIRRARHDELAEISHEICVATARRMKMDQTELMDLAFALQTFDLGLSGIPDEILYKTPPLEPEEWQIIHQHVDIGLELVAGLDVPERVLEFIKHHHEHYDGSGYPDKRQGEEIPLGSRLLGLADALTSMLQGRPYRRSQSLADALSDMETRSGRQFCPRSLAIFLEEASPFAEAVQEIQDKRFLALPSETEEESKDLISSPD